MWKPLLIIALLLAAISGPAQESKTPQKPATSTSSTGPGNAARPVNPVPPTQESIARGKKTYGYDCAMCHGKDGDGKGEAAKDLKLKIRDFTDPAVLKDRMDGELFDIIKNGKGWMPPEGDRLQANEIWDLINYIRSFAKKPAQTEDAPAHN